MKNKKYENSTKPIIFNTEMVRAILADKKTMTRRIAKIVDHEGHEIVHSEVNGFVVDRLCQSMSQHYNLLDLKNHSIGIPKPQYKVSDILYVRETWSRGYLECGIGGFYWEEIRTPKKDSPIDGADYIYRADSEKSEELEYNIKWRPAIHMPKEAARIFLRVTNVRLEELQNMTGKDAVAEGVEPDVLNTVGEDFAIGMFHDIWDSTIKKSDLPRYGWDANPWVWVYEFERIGGQT